MRETLYEQLISYMKKNNCELTFINYEITGITDMPVVANIKLEREHGINIIHIRFDNDEINWFDNSKAKLRYVSFPGKIQLEGKREPATFIFYIEDENGNELEGTDAVEVEVINKYELHTRIFSEAYHFCKIGTSLYKGVLIDIKEGLYINIKVYDEHGKRKSIGEYKINIKNIDLFAEDVKKERKK